MALWHCARPLQYVLETETDSLAERSVFRSFVEMEAQPRLGSCFKTARWKRSYQALYSQ
jgi:hypothetical protein